MRQRITDIRHLRFIALLVINLKIFILSDLSFLFLLLRRCMRLLKLLNTLNILLLRLFFIISSSGSRISLLLVAFSSLRYVFANLFLPLFLLFSFLLHLFLLNKLILDLLRFLLTVIPNRLYISVGLLVMQTAIFLTQR